MRHDMYAGRDTAGHASIETRSSRARDLSSDGSCAWTKYYVDQAMLDKVGRVYVQDFELFGWYDIEWWKERLEECLKRPQ